MKFLFLTTYYPPYSFGGDAMYIYRLAHALGDKGHQVDVIHCIDAFQLQNKGKPKIAFDDHPNVRRFGLKSGYGFLSPLLTQQTGRPILKQNRILEVINSTAYDVIHYHNISLLGPVVMSLNSDENSTIKLYTTHEHWLICPTHVLWKFNQRACESPECARCTLMAKRPVQLWRYTGLLDRMSKNIDKFLSPSQFTADMHAERGFPYPVSHFPYFIDSSDNDWKNPDPSPQERPFFLFVGRLEVIKGVQTLIDLWKRVEDYDLLIVGTGSYESTLRQMAKGNNRIKFLGSKSQEELGQ